MPVVVLQQLLHNDFVGGDKHWLYAGENYFELRCDWHEHLI
jgi:hypothetical protein